MAYAFIKIVNMSINASYLILFVVLMRFVLKKLPKKIFIVLWGFVALRLVCPFSYKSIVSIIPTAEFFSSQAIEVNVPIVNSGFYYFDNFVNNEISHSMSQSSSENIYRIPLIANIAAYAWIVGFIGMILYLVFTFLRIKQTLRVSSNLYDNIYECHIISNPFIFGIFKAKIFLPSGLSENDKQYVLLHEKAHLKQGDHILKLTGFLILSIHWFNPVVWVAYTCFCNDIEYATDEYVVKKLDVKNRKCYSNALVNCSSNVNSDIVYPLAFANTSIKKRILNVLSYKKPKMTFTIIALLLCTFVLIFLLADPVSETSKNHLINSGIEKEDISSYSYRSEYDYASITIKRETKKFSFVPSLLSSTFLEGTYEETEKYLILKADNGQNFTFKKENQTLIFIAELSEKVPIYRYKAEDDNPTYSVPDRSVFILE